MGFVAETIEFKKFRLKPRWLELRFRSKIVELRPYVPGEKLTCFGVKDNPREVGGMVARDPNNHKDQWYVSDKYFRNNFEPIS